MPHGYTAENHDWDLTLRAAWSLTMIGQAAQSLPTGGNIKEREFASYLGSMLLSFSAIESFSASVAFSLPRVEKYSAFDFEAYTRTQRFWDKLEMLFAIIPYQIDKSTGLFQTVRDMQRWRNLVTHSSPYRIEPTSVADTTSAPRKLHSPFQGKEYARKVSLDNAQKFYTCAFDYIHLVKELTSIDPRASVQYTVGSDDTNN